MGDRVQAAISGMFLGVAIGWLLGLVMGVLDCESRMSKANCGCYDTKTGAFKTGEDCK
jgi:hypothetical protein